MLGEAEDNFASPARYRSGPLAPEPDSEISCL